MIAEQLRNSILQAAIQGKLTEQLESDGHAKDLLQVINKDLKIPQIVETDLTFEIPNNWCWIKLGILFNVARGGSPRPIQSFLTSSIDGINWIKIGDSDIGGKYINETKEKIIPSGIKKSRLVFPGDLLLTNSMSFGRPYINNVKGCIHDGWLVLSPLTELLNKEFFYYLLSSDFIRMAFALTVAGAVVKNLNSDKVREILVPLPPAKEQSRIVARLENILPEVEKLKVDETKLEDLQQSFPKQMKESILQAAIQGKLTEQLATDGNARDLLKEIKNEKDRRVKEGKIKKDKPLPEISEDETPFDIPDNWCWVRLEELCTLITDGTHKTPKYVEKGIPFLSIQNISSGQFDFSNLKHITQKEHAELIKRCNPEKGDILFCRIGTLGRPIINELDFDFSIFVSLALIKLVNISLNKYLVYFFSSPIMTNWIDKNKVGGGTHTNKINLIDLHLVPVPLPPLLEQFRIVARLDEILPLCDSLD